MSASFWIILLAVFLYGMVHSILASIRAKALTRQWFGVNTDRWFRLFYNFVALVTLLPVLFLPILLIDRTLYRIPMPWMALTLLLQASALGMLALGLSQTSISAFIGLRQLLFRPEGHPSRFITNGLYRWVRHPLYTAGLIFIWLMPVMSCNLLALNIGLTLYICVGAIFEERKLQQEFGDRYSQYKAHTPMFIPGLRWRSDK
jgi:protein-S-isoprenylcysteine O-methyltransferase Ste14